MKRKKQNYLTPNEVAELLMVTPAAVRLWAEKGDIAAQTTPGGHRRFLRKEVERFATARGLNLEGDEKQQTKILIIEDDVHFAQYLEILVGQVDDKIQVEIVNDSFKAGLKVKEFEPTIILLDLIMPGIDGFEICKTIKESKATSYIRVIAVTSQTDPEVIKRILDAGAEACLNKPLELEELKGALKISSLVN